MVTKRVRGQIDSEKQGPDGRIKPGRTLNAKGRPPGSGNVADMRARVLNELISVEIGGRKQKMPVAEAAFRRLAQSALQGDARSIALIMREYAALEERQSKIQETYVFSEADRRTINDIYDRMRACEPVRS